VPFITEAVWERLNEMAPERGVAARLQASPLLAQAEWPKPGHFPREEALEAQVAFLQQAVTAIREVRARYTVPPSARLAMRIKASGDNAELLEPVLGLLAHMAGASEVTIAADHKKGATAATAIVRDVEVHVEGVVDPEKERAKLEKQKEQLLQKIAACERKLANEGFLAKAGEAVVAKERAQLEELGKQLAAVERGLG